jgi:hypothetical protein
MATRAHRTSLEPASIQALQACHRHALEKGVALTTASLLPSAGQIFTGFNRSAGASVTFLVTAIFDASGAELVQGPFEAPGMIGAMAPQSRPEGEAHESSRL